MALVSGIANAPVLPAGWKPVNHVSGQTFQETTLANWKYNYDPDNTVNGVAPKMWANAKDTKGNLWVWIPRFTYRAIQYADDPEVKIRFSNGTTDDTTSIDGRACKKHPGFKFGTVELPGIWVMKYQAYKDDANGGIPGSLPGKVSWRSITVNDIFNQCLNLKNNVATSATGLDSHMLKNSEWGAVALLAYAVGQGRPKINGDNGYHTGYTTNGQTNTTGSLDTSGETSTTGNPTGVFDMVGCAWEYVASYVNNGNSNLTTYCQSLVNADAKYKDVFPMGSGDTQAANYTAAAGLSDGMLLNETSTAGTGSTSWKNWNNAAAYSGFPCSSYPVFIRGGVCSASGAGLACFGSTDGNADGNGGFRACFVNLNSAPLISGEDANLGEKHTSFTVNYTVDDLDEGDVLTVIERVNDTVIRTINNAERGHQYTLDLAGHWAYLSLSEHTATITVEDDAGGVAVRTYTFTKTDDRIEFELKNPVETSIAAKRIVVSGMLTVPPGATLSVKACNNAFDAVPTWEDMTQDFLNRESHSFANSAKAANKWGINISFEILKNNATEPIIVDGFGFAFD